MPHGSNRGALKGEFNMKKNNVIAGILAMLCVMSISGCGDKETESSTAEKTTVATTETSTQATTVATTTEATTTTKESGSLELGMSFNLGSMSVDMPSNLLYYSEDDSNNIDGKLHYWKSTEWIVQASYTELKGTDSEVDFLVNLASLFDHDENDIDFCSIADLSSMIVTRKEKGDGIHQIAYYIADDGIYYSLVFCSKTDTDIKNDVKPIIDSIKFENAITEVKPKESADASKITSYKEGTYKVGTDIPSGEYCIYSTSNISGYYSVNADSKGDSIIGNDNFVYNAFLTVSDGQYLELSRAIAVPVSEIDGVTYKIDTSGSGTFRVGIDIPAGEYKLSSEGQDYSGYYCVYNNSEPDTKIVSNDNFEGQTYITVSDGQYLLLSRCKIVK